MIAFERATLYGLVVYSGRRVGYEKVDPHAAREIFIERVIAPALTVPGGLDRLRALLDNTAAFAFRGRILTDQAIWMDGTNCPSVQGAADFAVYGSPTVKTSLLRLDLRLASGATHADTFGMARFYVAGM